MRVPNVFLRVDEGPRFLTAILASVLVAHAGAGRVFGAGTPSPDRGPSIAPVATCVTETASLLRRPEAGGAWQVVKAREALLPGELLLGATDAALDSRNGAVQLMMVGDLARQSPFPVLETAVVLHEPGEVDLDFTMERGRVDLTNRRANGAARVRIHGRNRTAEIVLKHPGARMALEVYGRWLKGVPFSKEPRPGEGPALAIAALALKGEVFVKGERVQFTLKAPPGPALFMTSDFNDVDSAPEHLAELPAWATGADTEKSRRVKATLARFRQVATDQSINAAVDTLVNSDDETDRRTAIFLMGALDDLPRLTKVFANTVHPDGWDATVLALRHWIGRGPGQDLKLYRGLIDKAQFPPAVAEKVLDLLHSFGDEDLALPETYEMLIDYLENDRLAVRGLAYWHLYRLVPEGRKFGYDPQASKQDRARAIAQWRKLIPPGQLPAGPKSGTP